ncbi:MAG: GTP-binding protein [Promethearchaeota archaeon]|nr:MAG: GTP-binding protein [Candidatus Lokiarchaeota archaeon]
MSRRLLFKVIVVGDGGVGKSTMIQRLVTGHFIPQKITIGTDLATYSIPVEKKGTVKLQIWDFAGENRFRFFLPNYARGAVGCVLCYDVTRYASYENLVEWYDIVKNNAANPVFVLVGCKLDLADEKRVVRHDEGVKFKEKYNLDYFFETSSKSGKNNHLIFKTLTEGILEKKT